MKATLKCEAVSQFKEVLLDYLKPDKKQYSGRGIIGNKNCLDDPTGLSSFPVSGESTEIMQLSVMPGHCSPSGQPTNITFVVTLYFRHSKYRPIRLDGAVPLAWLLLFHENEKQLYKKNMVERRLNLKGPSILYTVTKNYIWSRNKDLTSQIHTQYKIVCLQHYCLIHLCLIVFVQLSKHEIRMRAILAWCRTEGMRKSFIFCCLVLGLLGFLFVCFVFTNTH